MQMSIPTLPASLTTCTNDANTCLLTDSTVIPAACGSRAVCTMQVQKLVVAPGWSYVNCFMYLLLILAIMRITHVVLNMMVDS